MPGERHIASDDWQDIRFAAPGFIQERQESHIFQAEEDYPALEAVLSSTNERATSASLGRSPTVQSQPSPYPSSHSWPNTEPRANVIRPRLSPSMPYHAHHYGEAYMDDCVSDNRMLPDNPTNNPKQQDQLCGAAHVQLDPTATSDRLLNGFHPLEEDTAIEYDGHHQNAVVHHWPSPSTQLYPQHSPHDQKSVEYQWFHRHQDTATMPSLPDSSGQSTDLSYPPLPKCNSSTRTDYHKFH